MSNGAPGCGSHVRSRVPFRRNIRAGYVLQFIRPVLNVLGFLYVGLATAMLIPAIVDVARDNPDWQAFVVSALLTGLIGMLLSLAVGGSLQDGLDTRQTFVLTTLSWATLPAFGALPFLWLGIGYTDAVFEAVSGFTTTGSTILTQLDTLPPGLLVWRSLMQWMGGVGIIVMAILLLPFLRIGGMQLFQSESSDRSEKIVSRSVELIRLIGLAYLFLTVALPVVLPGNRHGNVRCLQPRPDDNRHRRLLDPRRILRLFHQSGGRLGGGDVHDHRRLAVRAHCAGAARPAVEALEGPAMCARFWAFWPWCR